MAARESPSRAPDNPTHIVERDDRVYVAGHRGMVGPKLLDSSRIAALGWKPQVRLLEGLRRTYASAPFRV